MSEQNKNELSLAAEKVLQELQKNGDFEIKPCDVINIEDNPKYKKLSMTRSQQMRMSGFASQLPMMTAALGSASALSSASNYSYYVMTVPNGIPYTLTNLKDGFGNTLRGTDGKFAMQLPLYQADVVGALSVQTAVLSTFTAMSVATGQYFLSQINNSLSVIKMDIDRILGFLYGDKKAELLSEINFVRYVYQNYNSIMQNDIQRIATINSLQEARKIAFKDSEFYLSDLEQTVAKKNDESREIEQDIEKSGNLAKTLEMAANLYVTSYVMEVYYSQNFDEEYLLNAEKEISTYLRKYEMRTHSYFEKLLGRINDAKDHPFNNWNWWLPDRDKKIQDITNISNTLLNNEDSEMRKMLSSSLRMPTEKKEYYINAKGEVYVKTA